MKALVIIPARGGSKGIPHKNIKPLNGKPLIHYTIDVARGIASDEDICVSTDDADIIKCVEEYGLKVPFVRPAELATDTAGTYEVLLHALDFYEKQGKTYDVVLLLQNTSPFRTVQHVKEALELYRPDIDMVVSVYEYNGAIYVINAELLKKMPLGKFTKKVKYVMDDIHSVDLDNMMDWKYAEFIIKEGLV